MIRLLALLLALVAGTPAGAHPARFIPTLDVGDMIPPLPLTAQDGHTFTLADLRGNAVLVSFIYTRCRDTRMCPLVTAKFARIARQIGSAPIRLVLITLDPSYDTAPVLQRYGRLFGQNVRALTLATGSKATIDDVAGRFGIAASAVAPGVTVHTEAAVVISPDGRIARTIFGNTWSPAELIGAAQATLPGGAGPFIGLTSWLSSTLERCGGGSLALGGGGLIGIFAIALTATGVLFWRAFRVQPGG